MITAFAEYKISKEFVDKNILNIKKLMEDINDKGLKGVSYSSYILKDGQTFIHIGKYDSKASQESLLNLESFQYFQKERDKNIEINVGLNMAYLVASTKG